MIQKRYETITPRGKEFTPWFNYREDDSLLDKLRKEEAWQDKKSKLRNEFKIV